MITVGAADLAGTVRPERRLRRPVVGLRLHLRRVPQAGARRSRPLHDRRRCPTLDARLGAARSRRLARLHAALGHVVRRAGRLRRRGARARPAPGVHARPGEGRADGHRPPDARPRVVARARRDRRGACRDGPNPPNPNEALEAYVGGGTFDADAWQQAAQDNANWNQANWNQANWNSANWNAANWNAANWNTANWNQANWNSAQLEPGELEPGELEQRLDSARTPPASRRRPVKRSPAGTH